MTTPNPTPTQQETLEPLTDREFEQMEQWAGAGIADPQPYSDLMKLAVKTDTFLQRAIQEIRRTRRAAVAGPRDNAAAIALLDEWLKQPVQEDDGSLDRLRRLIDENRLSDRKFWPELAATSSPALTEKLPLPTNYECIAPSEQVYVINLLRGICDADKQEVARLHLNLCARCQELAGGVVPAERPQVAGEVRIPSDFITATGELKDWNAIATSDSARRAAKEIADYVSDGILGMGNEVTEANRAKFFEIINRAFTATPADDDAELKGESDA